MRERLIDRLAGRTKHRVVSASLHDDPPPGGIPGRLTPAAVLVPIVDHPEGMTVVFTRRTDHLTDHAGQICLPGGRVDPGDRDPAATALREAEEEVGLAHHQIEIVGRLDTCVTGTGFAVVPVVGVIAPPVALALDSFEVAEAFEVPLAFLLDPANHQQHSLTRNGVRHRFYALPYGDRYIWGATARMVVNLHEILNAPC